MTFPSNPTEEALLAFRNGQVEGERLLEALAGAELWVPLPAGAADEAGRLPIMVIEDAPYVAVYTSEEQFKRSAGNVTYAVTPGREFVRTLPPELGLAVNPGGDVGLPIGAEALPAIRGEDRSVSAGTRVMLGEPAEEPLPLLQAIATTLTSIPAVTSARRAWAVIGDAAKGSLIVGIALGRDDRQAREAALNAVAAAVQKSPVPFGVDSVFLNDTTDPLAAWLQENMDPFYTPPAPRP